MDWWTYFSTPAVLVHLLASALAVIWLGHNQRKLAGVQGKHATALENQKKEGAKELANFSHELAKQLEGVRAAQKERMDQALASLTAANAHALEDQRNRLAKERERELEGLRAEIARQLKEHEAQLRTETELEIVRWKKDQELFATARERVSILNERFITALDSQQHAKFAGRVALTRECYEAAHAAAVVLPEPFRQRVVDHTVKLGMWLRELESVAEHASRALIDENARGKQFIDSALLAKAAFDEFSRDLQHRHRSVATRDEGASRGAISMRTP